MSFVPIASYGLEQVVLRDVPRFRNHALTQLHQYLATVRIISLAISLGIGFVLIGYAVLTKGFEFWHLIIPAALVVMSGIVIHGEVFKGLSRPVSGVFFGHFLPVALFLCTTAGLVNFVEPSELLCLWVGCFTAAAVFVSFSKTKELKYRLGNWNRNRAKALLREGASICGGNALGAFAFTFPLIMLEAVSAANQVSFVTTAFRISILVSILIAAIHAFFAPAISRATDGGINRDQLLSAYFPAIKLSMLALGPPILVGIFFPGWIMSIFGEGFAAGAIPLRVLLINNLIALCLGPILQLLIMTGNARILPLLGALKLAVSLVLALCLIPQFGGLGMVIAVSSAFLLEKIIAFGILLRKVHPIW